MCGIVGCCGVEGAAGKIINGLERLEYRGYDSAGIALIDSSGAIKTEKQKGRISALCKALDGRKDMNGKTGIGHTRWATHGRVNDINSHPHQSGKFAVVHNGIIENHAELKEKYLKLVKLKSETDTEVVAALLNQLYSGNCLDALAQTARLLEGSFALAILCEDEPQKLYCIRKSSPLLVGLADGAFAASDIAAFSEKIETLYRMEDGEIAEISPQNVNFFDFNLKEIRKTPSKFSQENEEISKGNCEHFMLKEIYEQPQAISKTLGALKSEDFGGIAAEFGSARQIYITACGSAYHAGLVGKEALEKLLKKPVTVQIASEFRYSSPLLDSRTPVIIISQSGETADSLAALREAKKRGARTLAIVNVRESSIAQESDFVLFTQAGAEIAVATTKAYSAQLAVLYFLALETSRESADEGLRKKIEKELKELERKISEAMECEEQIKRIAKAIKDIDHAYFIGRGLGYCTAAEGSLKLKEISYIHSEAYPAGEMKHGTISLIEKGTVVFAPNSAPELTAKLQSNIDEVRARGAKVIAITCGEKINADEIIEVPKTHPLLSISTQIVPLQLLSYHVARLRGCDIDKPRNLAKSVTVE